MTPIKASAASLLACTLLISACTPPPNLAGVEGANTNTTSGAIMGAAAGAVLTGIVTGGAPEQIAAGAVAGGLVGGAIGNRLDKQAAELQRDLGNDAITVQNTGDQLLVSFPQDILFATDSTALQSSSRSALNTLAANLQSYPDTRVEVIGHTDNTGAAGYNFDLSARRAGAVSGVLVGAGVPSSRLTATGKGEDSPVASNLTEEGRALNRRVEVVIRPIT